MFGDNECTVDSALNCHDFLTIYCMWSYDLAKFHVERLAIEQGWPTCGPRYTSVWPAEPQDENK